MPTPKDLAALQGETFPYRVCFYDAAMSRKGKGSRQRLFANRAEAEKFAEGKRIYSKPSVVEQWSSEAGKWVRL